MTVIARDSHPHEATRTVVDIHTKEYINNTTDESNIRMSKVFKNGHYAFTSTKGIDFGFGSDIGTKVISLAVGGDSTLINAFFNRTGNKVAPNDDFTFTYHQEEKISVPHTPLGMIRTTLSSLVFLGIFIYGTCECQNWLV